MALFLLERKLKLLTKTKIEYIICLVNDLVNKTVNDSVNQVANGGLIWTKNLC